VSELENYRRWIGELRESVERKVAGLGAEQLAARSVEPSSLSVLGLVRHLAQMEHFWFVVTLSRSDEPRPYFGPGESWAAQFDDAVGTPECVEDALTTWRAVTARADAVMAGLEADDLETTWGEGRRDSVRGALTQVVYEYSRHLGHLDLLREAIDGQTGE
jgi:hypothetical protein